MNIPIIFKSNRYRHPKLYKDVIMTVPRHSQHPGHRKYVILFSTALQIRLTLNSSCFSSPGKRRLEVAWRRGGGGVGVGWGGASRGGQQQMVTPANLTLHVEHPLNRHAEHLLLSHFRANSHNLQRKAADAITRSPLSATLHNVGWHQ